MTAALLVLLGLSAPLRAPDLQVEAVTSAGAPLPELADAVARALVASGARVVLRGPTSGSCHFCSQVVVIDSGQGHCRVEVRQDDRPDAKQERHAASATLQFPAGSPLFDRARAIAIQARLLATVRPYVESRTKDVAAAHPSVRRSERKTPHDQTIPETPAATVAAVPIKAPEFVSTPPPAPLPMPLPAKTMDSTAVPERRTDSVLVAPVTYADRDGVKPAKRAEVKTSELARAKSRSASEEPTASVGVSESVIGKLEPSKPAWPWLPTLLGSGAAVAAGICAVVARDRYNALADRSQPYQTAQAVKGEGQKWQTASVVLSGVAVAGLTAGTIGFLARSSERSSERSSVTVVAAPVQGGGLVAIAGDFQ